jgi:hypothetical protein
VEFESDRWGPDAPWHRAANRDGDILVPSDVPVREVRDLAELLDLVREHKVVRITVPVAGRVPPRPRIAIGHPPKPARRTWR